MEEPSAERNLRALVEYEGTAYVGWERQKNGLGIQDVLEEAIRSITGEQVVVEGSGRTDAGVHALGQVASFRLGHRIAARKLRLALNAVMPPDVAVLELEDAPLSFHARKSARSKHYRYTILNGRARRPLERHRSYHFPREIDLNAMREAATHFVGTHDFSAFAREADRKKSCVRTLLAATVTSDGSFVYLDFEGSGFLYNMVRILTGTLLEVGVGRREALEMPALLRSGRRDTSGFTVPPHGLALVRVVYGGS